MKGDQFALFKIEESAAVRLRNRNRERAGKSERSHIKHGLLKEAVSAQIAAYRIRHKGRIILIDGNAGDGNGVKLPQIDLFGENPSCATAEMLVRIAEKDGNADVVLCEIDPIKRVELEVRFPAVTILSDHRQAPSRLRPCHEYALWLSDPTGPSKHGITHMRAISDAVLSDFVIVFNEGFLTSRLDGVKPGTTPQARAWATAKERYQSMVVPDWWTRSLKRKRLARTNIIYGSPSFHYRILIVADYLSQGATREPFEVVI